MTNKEFEEQLQTRRQHHHKNSNRKKGRAKTACIILLKFRTKKLLITGKLKLILYHTETTLIIIKIFKNQKLHVL